ncbi:MAG: hypothetical protein NVV59_11220, partial [Chitinophagaceae bacterium]|nr:hypothetical protein [Chitinophagaceae bacterium]
MTAWLRGCVASAAFRKSPGTAGRPWWSEAQTAPTLGNAKTMPGCSAEFSGTVSVPQNLLGSLKTSEKIVNFIFIFVEKHTFL